MQVFDNVYVVATGNFMPGGPVNNEEMDQFIAPVDDSSPRLKKRILKENGIQTRHYAIDKDGNSLFSVAQMGAQAVTNALQSRDIPLTCLNFLSTASTGADSAAPGLANYVQAELHLQPVETLSVQGICASSMGALKAAAQSLSGEDIKFAGCVASEFPSRLFKKSRFLRAADHLRFDAHFLRWMLSDGAGAAILSNQPYHKGLSFKLNWIHNKSFSGQLPTCMNVGGDLQNTKHYLDYPSLREAEEAGAFFLRQDIRLLPNLFDLGVSELSDIVNKGFFNPNEIDHFLCHYSSERFSGMIKEVLHKANMMIAPEKWFSNLKSKGNTGAASIFIMMDEFFKNTDLKPGQKILGMVPESGRFTMSFFLMEVVDSTHSTQTTALPQDIALGLESKNEVTAGLLRDLMGVWHNYRNRVYQSPLAKKIFAQNISLEEYRHWMECWIPQVREGSHWMRTAIEHLPEEMSALKDIIHKHANEEMNDFKVLYDDYIKCGGKLAIDQLERNPAGEALNSFMYKIARSPHAYELLGATFIIEGTGQRIIPTLLPSLKNTLRLQGMSTSNFGYRFLEYHGENDVAHMNRWLDCIELVLAQDPTASQRIVKLARSVSDLYAAQWEWAL